MRNILLIIILSLSVASAQSDRALPKSDSRPGQASTNACDDCFKDYKSYCRVYNNNDVFITDNPFAMNGDNGNIIIKGTVINEPAFFTATNWSSNGLQYINEPRYIIAGMETSFKQNNLDEEDYKCIIEGGDIYDINANIGDVDFRINTNDDLEGEIKLLPGFHAESGSYFHAYIKPKITQLDRYNHNFTTTPNLIEIRRRWNVRNSLGVQITDFDQHGWNFRPNIAVFTDNNLVESERYRIFSKEPIHTSNEPFGRYESIVKMCTKMGIRVSPWFLQNSGGLQQIEYDVPELNVSLTRQATSGASLDNCTGDNTTNVAVNEICAPCRNHFLMGYAKWFDATKIKETTVLGWWGGRNGAVFPVYDPNTNDPLGTKFRLYSLEILRDEVRYLIDDCVVARLPALNRMNSRNYNETVNHSRGVPYWIIYGAEPLMDFAHRCYFELDLGGNDRTTVKELRAFDITPW